MGRPNPIHDAFGSDAEQTKYVMLIMKLASDSFRKDWLGYVCEDVLHTLVALEWLALSPVYARNGVSVSYYIPELTDLGTAIFEAHETGMYA